MAANDPAGSGEYSSENNSFIRETVKKPKKRWWKKLLLTLFLALVFGITAALAFYFTDGFLRRGETSAPYGTVTFPVDEDPRQTEEVSPSGTLSESEAAGTEDTGSLTEPGSSEAESGTAAEPLPSETLPTETAPSDPSGTTQDIESLFESFSAEHTLGLEGYKQIGRAADGLVNEIGHSVVTVVASGVTRDWFESEYSYNTKTFGVIVAITKQEVLILTSEDLITQLSENSSLTVTFGNLAESGAYTKATDTVSGLAVLAVSTDTLSAGTASYIRAITLGSSYSCTAGQHVIAMGAPAGAVRSVSYGALTHVENDVAAPDSSFSILHTDILGDETSRGFLTDLDGRLIGWISPEYSSGIRLNAIGISGIKNYIEKLSNGIPIGYLGILGQTVSASVAEERGLPGSGLYVISCVEGSPAFRAGLQSGDLIVELAGSAVGNLKNLQDALLGMNTEQTVKLKLLRKVGNDYREMTFDVKIERR